MAITAGIEGCFSQLANGSDGDRHVRTRDRLGMRFVP
jgi:hypothetical protein